ncbi:PhzF family phenazine biosynthesis protein [Halorubrum sp. BV1]|uniref:PhzF family phenazine biosynthesis protein n=1 Tax=Halorubrum sp. BV1 TaxID=1498500 RepID=UPI000679B537|nr:PhzF family phenazine biosynthesis protein [Halorubrum sp. BV1]
METRRALLVDAFTDEPLTGNVAGVVPDASGLSDGRMAQIAAELGASETAFLVGSGDRRSDDNERNGDESGESDGSDTADEQVRYFTPATEVDLCGHATIASYGALYADGAVDAGERTLRTNVGDLAVRIGDDGTVWMRQKPPTVDVVGTETLDAERLGGALGVDPAALADIGADLPVAVASTGLPWLVVPVNFLQRLGEADPDSSAIKRISDEFDVAGVYAFTFDTLEAESTVHGRAFAPALGIEEDSVTGTASGAVAGYLRAVEAFDGDFPEELRFEQGHFLDRPGHVRARVDGDEVRVGGAATIAAEVELRLPAGDADSSDEILEA